MPSRVRRLPLPDYAMLLLLAAACVALLVGLLVFGPSWVPPVALVLPLLLGGLLLPRRQFLWLTGVALVATVVEMLAVGVGVQGVRPGAVLVVAVAARIAYAFTRFREETGLSGASGEGVLVELRERLETQGRLPPLPLPWRVEATIRPAGGGPFAGDFVASSLTGSLLEIALVDVSGKGVAAGTRALMLSGALGGLLGAVPFRHFLPAANAYVDRQEWTEGFATAVHVALDLATGRFVVGSAGHPPAALFDAGSGRWSLLPAEGPVLGLIPAAEFTTATGSLDPGDALLLYTDGLVEVAGRDLALGIDKLLGEAERLVTRGFAGGADTLVAAVAPESDDDRGVVLVWRGYEPTRRDTGSSSDATTAGASRSAASAVR